MSHKNTPPHTAIPKSRESCLKPALKSQRVWDFLQRVSDFAQRVWAFTPTGLVREPLPNDNAEGNGVGVVRDEPRLARALAVDPETLLRLDGSFRVRQRRRER